MEQFDDGTWLSLNDKKLMQPYWKAVADARIDPDAAAAFLFDIWMACLTDIPHPP